jgi:hypothetical protein
MVLRDEFIQVATSVPFDNSVNGFNSDNVQDAIEEVQAHTFENSKGFIFCSYNGNGNVGRYLEFFSGIDSSIAPLKVIGSLDILTIVTRTTASNATCTIGFYDIATTPTLLYTVTFSKAKEVINTDTILFTLPANGELAIKVDSGSINKPYMYFVARGG